MRYILFLLVAMLQMPLLAQGGNNETDALLDKVVAGIKAAAPVQMDYTYTVYDDESQLVQADKGVIFIDNDRYALLMEFMKVWCDGKVQWSYMKDIDEVYITGADSEEAQNLSPLYIMEKYRENYSMALVDKGASAMVVLTSKESEEEIERLELVIDKETARLQSLFIYMSAQGKVEVFLNNYVAKCSFGRKEYECPVNAFPTAEIIDMR